MPPPARRLVVRGATAAALVVLAVLAVLAMPAVLAVTAGDEGTAAAVAPATPTTTTTQPATTTTFENVFLPENADLDDCISAAPRPGCGSKARGGWRQAAVFAVVIAGLAFITWRVVRTVRRRPPAGIAR